MTIPYTRYGWPLLRRSLGVSGEVLLRSSGCDLCNFIERRVFKEPAIRPNQYAIQICRDSINAVMATLQRNRLEEHVMPGADSRHSQMFFANLTKEEVELVADTHRSASYVAILAVTWYQGDGIKSMH